MEVNDDRPTKRRDVPVAMASDTPSDPRDGLVTTRDDSLVEPIIVANSTWTPADPTAYNGGQPAQITHLRELELGDKSDNARWGALDIIPTKADYVLDLIRINSPVSYTHLTLPTKRIV